jgi:hypothetical protein
MRFRGRWGVRHAVVSQAYNIGRTATGGMKPEVALFAVSASILEAFTDRVVELAKANQILTQFHKLRRADIEAGKRPRVQESLAVMA